MGKSKYIIALMFIFHILFFAAARNVGFLLIGVIIWWLAFKYRTYTSSGVFLPYYIGLIFWYPSGYYTGLNFHNPSFVFGVFSLFFYLFNRRQIYVELRKNRVVRNIILFWLVWSAASYAPVLISSLGLNYFPFSLIYSKDLAVQTTLLKTTVGQFAVLLILLPILTLKKVEDFQVFYKAIFIATAVVVIMGFIQYFTGFKLLPEHYSDVYLYSGGYSRFFTFSMPDANGFARLMIIPILLSFIYISVKRKTSITILFVLSLTAVVLTYSRTGFASISFGIFILLCLFLGDIKIKHKSPVFVIICLVLLGANIVKLGYTENVDRFISMRNLQSRWLLHERAFEIIKDNPFFGAHPSFYQQQMLEGFSFSGRSWVPSAHNIYLQVGVDWGLPLSLVLILCLLISLYYYGIRGRRLLKKLEFTEGTDIYILVIAIYCVIGVAFTYIVHSITEIVPPVYIFFLLGFSITSYNLVLFKAGQTPH